MMRVINPPITGPIVARELIYVDSPEVTAKYQAEVDSVRKKMNEQLTENIVQVNQLKDELSKQAAQIAHYVKLIDEQRREKAKHAQTSIKADSGSPDTAILEDYIKKLRVEIQNNKQIILTLESDQNKNERTIAALEAKIGSLISHQLNETNKIKYDSSKLFQMIEYIDVRLRALPLDQIAAILGAIGMTFLIYYFVRKVTG